MFSFDRSMFPAAARIQDLKKMLGGGIREALHMHACGIYSGDFQTNPHAWEHARALQILNSYLFIYL